MTEEQIAVESEELTAEAVESVKNVFLLKERFEINFKKPLENLNTNGAEAFEVKDHITPQRKLFALICSNETSPRLSYLAYLKSIDTPNILKLIEYGIIKNSIGIGSLLCDGIGDTIRLSLTDDPMRRSGK